jgi:pimeloyl-ACP methyl ester carboxylesterase
MDELAGEYRLVAPDQRGYNISDKPPEVADYLLPKLADDILKLLPLVSAEPVILVAHDWGGPVGWLVAHHADAHIRGFMATNGPHPARLADLIANDPEQKQASSYMALFRSDTAEQFLTPDYIVKEFFGFLSPEDEVIYLEALSQPGAITGGLNWYRANDIDVDSVKALMAEVSPTVNVPVSVLWGLDDTAVLPKNADGLEPYAPDLEVETFAGVDHWIEHRIPGKIADAIRALDKRITSK